MKILITGYFGSGNFGDDMMLEAFCKEMKNINSNHDIHLLKMFERDIDVEIDESIKQIPLYRLSTGRGIRIKSKMIRHVYKKIIKKYDMLIWVGGTCFTDEDGDGFYNYMKIAKEYNKKIGYVGVGVGKLTKLDRINKAEYLIKNCDFISLRDKKSYEYVKKVRGNTSNIFLTEDLAYLFVNSLNVKNNIKNKSKKIVVSWRNLINYKSEFEEEILIKELTEYLNNLSNKGIYEEIIVLPLDDRKDCSKNKLIYDNLQEKVGTSIRCSYKENLSPIEKIKVILDAELNISGRLHGIFVSELANIKTIGMSYSIKIDEFLDSIRKINDCIDVSDLSVKNLGRMYNQENILITNELLEEKVRESKNNIYLLNKYLNESGEKYEYNI